MKSKPIAKRTQATQATLAAALGVSRQLISAHASKPEAPPLSDTSAWLLFLAAQGRTGSLPADLRRKIGEVRLAILEQQKIAAERDNQKRAGEMMLTADAERQAGEAWRYLFGEFDRAKRELPPALVGLEAIPIYKRLHEFIEGVRARAKEKFESIGQ